MKSAKIIVVKTLLSPEEFLAFDAECKLIDAPQSRVLRNLARSWMAERKEKNTRKVSAGEWADHGQKVAMFPSRNYGVKFNMPLRV